jgi:hypothetical protein
MKLIMPIKFSRRFYIFLIYFSIIFLLPKLRNLPFTDNLWPETVINLVNWFLGAFIGSQFIKVDHLIYIYVTHPTTQLAIEARNLIKQKKLSSAFLLLNNRLDEQRLAFLSAPFQAIWAVLAFFTLSSITSLFSRALVMAVGLNLLLEEWSSVYAARGTNWLFWQIKRQVSAKEQKWFLWAMTVIFCLLSLALV